MYSVYCLVLIVAPICKKTFLEITGFVKIDKFREDRNWWGRLKGIVWNCFDIHKFVHLIKFNLGQKLPPLELILSVCRLNRSSQSKGRLCGNDRKSIVHMVIDQMADTVKSPILCPDLRPGKKPFMNSFLNIDLQKKWIRTYHALWIDEK